MNARLNLIFPVLLSIVALDTLAQRNQTSEKSNVKEVILCGDDKVRILDRRQSNGDDLKMVWEWSPSVATDLPESYRKYFRTTDECKPVDGDKLLITSSSGAVALVDRKTKATLFYAHVPNAHSAAHLPGNRVVVALSTAPKGNRIQLFDVGKPDKVLYEDTLYSGHGAVWIPERKKLFVLGFDVLRTYSLKNWESETPELQKENEWRLPDNGGHDLSRVSRDQLLLTTSNSVWTFDIGPEAFTPFGPLKDVKHVKSVNYDSSIGELVYTKGEISWWTHNIYFRNPDDTLKVDDVNVYKVRVIGRQQN